MPIDYREYAPYWKKLSEYIRFVRAKNLCEWCGIENYSHILRNVDDGADYAIMDDSGDIYYHGQRVRVEWLPVGIQAQERLTKVVLTVAHIDHDKTNNRFSNLAALCQRCHLLHDMAHHQRKAAITRGNKANTALEATGQLRLFDEPIGE